MAAIAPGVKTASPGDCLKTQHGEPVDEFLVKETFVPTKRQAKKMMVKRRKQKVQTPLANLCATIVEHQLGFSINLLLLLGLTHAFFPRARRRTSKFFEMQYYNAAKDNYTQGFDDVYYVSFWLVIFTFTRVATMEYVLKPFARMGGITTKKGLVRFAEQGWMFLYYSAAWTFGMWIMYNSDYWFNLRAMWADFPTRTMSAPMKWYYLVQFSFWLQQLFVVNIEEPRKDHWQMFTHHVFTSFLMLFSYGFYQTKVGNVILCIMDLCDILLSLAKMLNYLSFSTICDVTFGVFIAAWFVSRHIFYNMVSWSIHAHVPDIMPYGCFDPVTGDQVPLREYGNAILPNMLRAFGNDIEKYEPVCFNNKIRLSFLGLLMALQVLTVIWFGMIIRVAYRVISGKGAQDSRSDDEGEDEDEEEELEIDAFDHPNGLANGQHYIVEEVDGEAINLSGSKRQNGSPLPARRSSRRSPISQASGISIPGHGDHKELLGRIGCDKPS